MGTQVGLPAIRGGGAGHKSGGISDLAVGLIWLRINVYTLTLWLLLGSAAELDLGVVDDLACLLDHVRTNGDGGDPPLHQLFGNLRVNGGCLAADARGNTTTPCDCDRSFDGGHDSFVALVEGIGESLTVAIDAQNQLGQVVGADGDPIDTNVDEAVEDDNVGGNFHHHPELEVVHSPDQTLLGQEILDAFQLSFSPDEGNHDVQVLEFLADLLDRLDF